MIRSLYTAATGMKSQQFNIDTITNNLSNVNTTGFKKNRADFADLYYQTLRTSGTPIDEEQVIPTGIQSGLGSKVVGTQKIFDQGSFKQTNNTFDLALQGKGFFQLKNLDGETVYSRNGSFVKDANGKLVNMNGLKLFPEITIPDNVETASVAINELGQVRGKLAGSDQDIFIGSIQTVRFSNDSGLMAMGENIYRSTEASGNAIEGTPGLEGQPLIRQKFIEMSNVKVVDEMVNMITAQRAYEMNSKSIQTSDNMLQTAIGMKR